MHGLLLYLFFIVLCELAGVFMQVRWKQLGGRFCYLSNQNLRERKIQKCSQPCHGTFSTQFYVHRLYQAQKRDF
jgi:hypothetical protein